MHARWWLDDAEDRQREAPRTFFIPTLDRREALGPGDLVKLIFLVDPPTSDGTTGERMWVEVISGGPDGYTGELLNSPDCIPGLEAGHTVTFAPAHVAAIAVDEEEYGYRIDDSAAISRRLRDEDARPVHVRRYPPNDRADKGDSGWELTAAEDDDAFLSEDGNLVWWDLGYITDKFPEVEPLFKADPDEGDWIWDEAVGSYRSAE